MHRKSLIDFIRRQDLAGALRYTWDDDDPLKQFPDNDPRTEERLSRVSHRAKFAFALGCAEWVLARLQGFTDAVWPWQFRDACWAYALDDAFGLPEEIEDHPQEGVIDGPPCLALTTVLNTRYGFDEDNAEIDAATAELIPLWVLSDATAFLKWREEVLQRLSSAHPRDPYDPIGARVAIDVLDPLTDPRMARGPTALADSLSRLELEENPYVVRLADERG